jgi:hypothetical protein
MLSYPDWRFFPAYAPPPDWVGPLVDVFRSHRAAIDSLVIHDDAMKGDLVLSVLAEDLEDQLGFEVEKGEESRETAPSSVLR